MQEDHKQNGEMISGRKEQAKGPKPLDDDNGDDERKRVSENAVAMTTV